MSETRVVRPKAGPQEVARERAARSEFAPAHGTWQPMGPPGALMSEHERWLELQRGIGNQGVSRLLRRQTPASPTVARASAQPGPTPQSGKEVLESGSCAPTQAMRETPSEQIFQRTRNGQPPVAASAAAPLRTAAPTSPRTTRAPLMRLSTAGEGTGSSSSS